LGFGSSHSRWDSLLVETFDIISTLARQFALRISLHTKKTNKKMVSEKPSFGQPKSREGIRRTEFLVPKQFLQDFRGVFFYAFLLPSLLVGLRHRFSQFLRHFGVHVGVILRIFFDAAKLQKCNTS